jgi:hypothetical protein
MCCFRFSFLVIFRALSWRFSWSDFEAFIFGFWWGMYAWTLRGSFPFDSPPKSVSKGARFWGFRGSRVRGVLGGICSIPLVLASFGGPNLGYGVLMRCSYYPQSLVQNRGAIREIGSWFWGELTHGCCSSRAAQSDQCCSPVWLVQRPCVPRVNVLVLTVYFGTPNMFITLWFGFVMELTRH